MCGHKSWWIATSEAVFLPKRRCLSARWCMRLWRFRGRNMSEGLNSISTGKFCIWSEDFRISYQSRSFRAGLENNYSGRRFLQGFLKLDFKLCVGVRLVPSDTAMDRNTQLKVKFQSGSFKAHVLNTSNNNPLHNGGCPLATFGRERDDQGVGTEEMRNKSCTERWRGTPTFQHVSLMVCM